MRAWWNQDRDRRHHLPVRPKAYDGRQFMQPPSPPFIKRGEETLFPSRQVVRALIREQAKKLVTGGKGWGPRTIHRAT